MTVAASIAPPAALPDPASQSPFLKSLIGLVRAEDSYGAWDKMTDAEILRDFIVTKEQRRAIPIIGDPEPDVLNRLQLYYRAVALASEKQTGLLASPMMNMSHEGFGRVLLTVGRLVAFSRTVRDVHRFGFEDFDKLSAEGMKVVGLVVEAVDSHPEVARL